MSRAIPLITRQDLERSASADALLFFVTITHPDMADVIRLVTDGVDYRRGDATWHKAWFELTALTDADSPPRTEFAFPNVAREQVTKLQAVSNPCIVTFELISSVYFDLTADPRTVKPGMTVEPIYKASHLHLTDVTMGGDRVAGTLRSWDYRQEAWPDIRATEDRLPGAYAR